MQRILLKKQTKSFQQRVYDEVKKIRKGKVLTYKRVAELAGSPKAFRAVGNILNKNKNPEIPCHRVIRSDGKPGGYNRGTRKKVLILRREGIKMQ
jgi:methylated-DNA-[protein]-cysteine S-methyltransferase